MFDSNLCKTKEKIYRTAAKLFSMLGYDNVSMEDLAKAVGIRTSVIHKHFQSKKGILSDLYRAYGEQRIKATPDLKQLLKLAEVKSPAEALMMTIYSFPTDIAEMMHCILVTAAHNIVTDADSRQFIVDHVFSTTNETVVPVIKKLVKLGRIEPVDTEAFNSVLLYYAFGAIMLHSTPFGMDASAWPKGLEYLYSSLIRPTGKCLH